MSKVIMCGVDMHDNSLVCRMGMAREPAESSWPIACGAGLSPSVMAQN